MTELLYSFDTSVMINGRRDLLPPDLFPTLWTKLEGMIASGAIRAVDVVRDELGRKDDDAKKWATNQAGLFLPLDEDIQLATRTVLAQHSRLVGKGGQRNLADPFVIGLARARGGIVVTQETRTNNLEKPRIPDVCKAMGVRASILAGSSATRAGPSDDLPGIAPPRLPLDLRAEPAIRTLAPWSARRAGRARPRRNRRGRGSPGRGRSRRRPPDRPRRRSARRPGATTPRWWAAPEAPR